MGVVWQQVYRSSLCRYPQRDSSKGLQFLPKCVPGRGLGWKPPSYHTQFQGQTSPLLHPLWYLHLMVIPQEVKSGQS